MARTARDSRLEARSNRVKLPLGQRHWKVIDRGLAVGYRRTSEGYGVWLVRCKGTWSNAYVYRSVGRADDNQEADGVEVLTFSQAQAKARAFSQEINKTQLNSGKPITVAEAASTYLEWFKDHRKSFRETAATIEAHILPALGTRLLSEIRTPELRKWHESLATAPARKRTSKTATKRATREAAASADEKRARRSTANRILTVFKAIANKAFQDGHVSDDIAWRRLKPFPNTDEPVTRFLSGAESKRLVNCCPGDFRKLVTAALLTGCRYGELARLTVGDVNLQTSMVYVTPDAKSGRGRHVPLNDEAQSFFGELLAGRRASEPLFQRPDGRIWGKNHHVRLLHAACAKAKIDPAISFHELRHTFASNLAQAGVDLLTISKLLGHADTRITSRHYAHLCDESLRHAVCKLPVIGSAGQRRVVEFR
jgi:integrase